MFTFRISLRRTLNTTECTFITQQTPLFSLSPYFFIRDKFKYIYVCVYSNAKFYITLISFSTSYAGKHIHTKHRSALSLANKVHKEIAVYITTAPVNTKDISFTSSPKPHILFLSLMEVISVLDCVEIFTFVQTGTLFNVTERGKKNQLSYYLYISLLFLFISKLF
jgi:hypothetical protein